MQELLLFSILKQLRLCDCVSMTSCIYFSKILIWKQVMCTGLPNVLNISDFSKYVISLIKKNDDRSHSIIRRIH